MINAGIIIAVAEKLHSYHICDCEDYRMAIKICSFRMVVHSVYASGSTFIQYRAPLAYQISWRPGEGMRPWLHRINIWKTTGHSYGPGITMNMIQVYKTLSSHNTHFRDAGGRQWRLKLHSSCSIVHSRAEIFPSGHFRILNSRVPIKKGLGVVSVPETSWAPSAYLYHKIQYILGLFPTWSRRRILALKPKLSLVLGVARGFLGRWELSAHVRGSAPTRYADHFQGTSQQ